MTPKTTGWVVGLAAFGMMLGMIAVDITTLMEWHQMTTPVFVGTTLGHVAATIAAFVGGWLIPTERGAETTLKTRKDDPKP